MKDSEILREARPVLFERGWHQGDYDGEDGTVCVFGAINVAVGLSARGAVYPYTEADIDADRRALAAAQFMCDDVLHLTAGIGTWNDNPSRTFDEVIDALERGEKLALIREEGDE